MMAVGFSRHAIRMACLSLSTNRRAPDGDRRSYSQYATLLRVYTSSLQTFWRLGFRDVDLLSADTWSLANAFNRDSAALEHEPTRRHSFAPGLCSRLCEPEFIPPNAHTDYHSPGTIAVLAGNSEPAGRRERPFDGS